MSADGSATVFPMTLLSTSRRTFLREAGLLTAASAVAPAAFAGPVAFAGPAAFAQAAPSLTLGVQLRLGGGPAGATVPMDFIGLSYEAMQLEDPTFFSPDNVSLVQQFRLMSPTGVLRLGGNTSEYGWWKPTDASTPPTRTQVYVKDGEPPPTTIFAITPKAVQNLDGFLKATGWTCIYGLNLGYGTPESDIPEAIYVFNTLGPRLQYFQLGNEVDLFKGHLRNPDTWNVNTYLAEWLHIARAVQKALPAAKFGMPDVAADVTWLTQIADRWAAVEDKPNVTTLSHHYYWSGPPKNPNATIERLLQPDAKVSAKAALARTAGTAMGKPWRMTEGNTIYQGGKPGLSDAYASALWSADYLLRLMSMGYCGVNLHGGSGHAQAVSVGGMLRGEDLMKDPTTPHPKPFYTPIANEGTLAGAGTDGKLNDKYLLEPTGYGMKFAAAFRGATMLPLDFDPVSLNCSAYAARRPDGKVIVAILNKSAVDDITITAPIFDTIQVLTGPKLEGNETHLTAVVRETSSRRTAAGQTFILPKHTATLIVLR